MLEVSAIQPMKAGHIAPPATIITSSEDPFLVNPPRFFMPRAKMVGNMIDMQK